MRLTLMLQDVVLVEFGFSGCLQLLEILEIFWNFIDARGKFNICQLKYDNMPITEPNLVTSLNLRNCLTIFC